MSSGKRVQGKKRGAGGRPRRTDERAAGQPSSRPGPAALVKHAESDPGSLSPGETLALQRMIGNRAVRRSLERGPGGSALARKETGRPDVRRQDAPEAGDEAFYSRAGGLFPPLNTLTPGGQALQRQEEAAEQVREAFREAVAVFERRTYRPAILALERVRQMPLVPDDVRRGCLRYIGLSNLRLGRHATAIIYLEQYLEMPGADTEEGESLLREAKQGAGVPVEQEMAEGGAEMSAEEAGEMFQDAVSLFERGRYGRAIVRFERVRQTAGVPDEVRRECLLHIGRCNLHLYRYATAIIYFERYLSMPGADREAAEAVLSEARQRAGADAVSQARALLQGLGAGHLRGRDPTFLIGRAQQLDTLLDQLDSELQGEVARTLIRIYQDLDGRLREASLDDRGRPQVDWISWGRDDPLAGTLEAVDPFTGLDRWTVLAAERPAGRGPGPGPAPEPGPEPEPEPEPEQEPVPERVLARRCIERLRRGFVEWINTPRLMGMEPDERQPFLKYVTALKGYANTALDLATGGRGWLAAYTFSDEQFRSLPDSRARVAYLQAHPEIEGSERARGVWRELPDQERTAIREGRTRPGERSTPVYYSRARYVLQVEARKAMEMAGMRGGYRVSSDDMNRLLQQIK